MPRKPKFIHTVRRIREIAGFPNQRSFAEYLGISPALLLSIENGRRSLTNEMASRVHWLTGCSIGQLIDGHHDQPPRDDGGRPFTRAHFDAHREFLGEYAKEDFLRSRVRAMAFWTWTLLRAARLRDLSGAGRHGKSRRRPHTTLIVAHRAARALAEVAQEFELAPEIARVLRAYGEVKKFEEPDGPGDWRRQLRAVNKWRASKGKGPMKMADFQRECRKPNMMVPVWLPQHDVPRKAMGRWRAELRRIADPKAG